MAIRKPTRTKATASISNLELFSGLAIACSILISFLACVLELGGPASISWQDILYDDKIWWYRGSPPASAPLRNQPTLACPFPAFPNCYDVDEM